MPKYRCKICGKIIEIEDINKIEKCPICMADKQFLELVEDEANLVVEEITGPIPIAKENPGIERIEEKCIQCGQCSKVCQNKVGIKYNPKKSKSPVCLSCGQCILNCPVGAIVPKYCYKKVMDYIKDTEKVVIAFTSPAVRVALGEEFLSEEKNVEGKMVSALKELGFDYVLDTTFGADLTIMEEATELVERIQKRENIPQFTSCCPAWVRYLEIYHPNLRKYLSTCKSPIGMQGTMIKTYYSDMMGIPKENIIAVAITPCTAKKYEIELPNSNDTDYVITTSELAMMIRENKINFNNLKDQNFDSIMQRGSGAGVIFGASGGVMEAAVRTAYYFITGKNPEKEILDFHPVRGYNNMKEGTVTINGVSLRLLTVHGMKNIEPILKEIENGTIRYDFIEVMNCPGGCVGGGGQPLSVVSKQQEIAEKRINALYQEDKNLKVRLCHKNPDIIDIYKSYLDHPGSNKSRELLHTKYIDRSSILGEESL